MIFSYQFAPLFNKIFYLSCKNLLSKTDILEQLKNEKYDVMIAETFDYCGFGLFIYLLERLIFLTNHF